MKKTDGVLDSLYNGKINMNEKIPKSKKYLKILKECNITLGEVYNKLDDADKWLLDKYIEGKSEMASMECREKFIEGYKLAIELMLAGIK